MNNKIVEINNISYDVYADLKDAEKYNNAILGSTWSSLDEVSQSQLLVMATRKIDSYNYAGQPLLENQVLKFPRIMRNGVASNENLLTLLCCQIASFYNDNGSASSSSSSGGESDNMLANVKDYKIGDFQISFKDDVKFDTTGIDSIIQGALSEWLKSNSMEIWL